MTRAGRLSRAAGRAIMIAWLAAAVLFGTSFTARAPDALEWRFLFAAFSAVDADLSGPGRAAGYASHRATDAELELFRAHAGAFAEFMRLTGAVSPRYDFVVIDEPVRELERGGNWIWIGPDTAGEMLAAAGIDPADYDQVFGIASLGLSTGYFGLTGASFPSGTGYSFFNFLDEERALSAYALDDPSYSGGFVHEFLHALSGMAWRYGRDFDLHAAAEAYVPCRDDWREFYSDLIMDRSRDGSGVPVEVWEDPPRLRAG